MTEWKKPAGSWSDHVNLDDYTEDQKWQIDRDAAKFELLKRIEREEPVFKFFWMLTALGGCLGFVLFGLALTVKNGPSIMSVATILVFFPLWLKLTTSFNKVAIAAVSVKLCDWKRRLGLPFYDPRRPVVSAINKVIVWIAVLAYFLAVSQASLAVIKATMNTSGAG